MSNLFEKIEEINPQLTSSYLGEGYVFVSSLIDTNVRNKTINKTNIKELIEIIFKYSSDAKRFHLDYLSVYCKDLVEEIDKYRILL